MRALYAPFQRNHDRLIVMDVKSAELTKYAANAMLATRISFMNELAKLAEKLGADIEQRAPRHRLRPAHRLPLPLRRLRLRRLLLPQGRAGPASAPPGNTARTCAMLNAVEAVNERQKEVLLDKITAKFGNDLSGKTFALWGLAFKPNTDDMREAPSRVLIEGLWARGAKVVAHDPVAAHETRRIFGDDPRLKLVDSPMEAVDGADALVIVTEWKVFRAPNFPDLKAKLKHPVIFDGRNMYEPKDVREAGLEYFAIGRL